MTDMTMTFTYKIAFFDQNVGESAAMAAGNFALILVVVLLYPRVSRWREEVPWSSRATYRESPS